MWGRWGNRPHPAWPKAREMVCRGPILPRAPGSVKRVLRVRPFGSAMLRKWASLIHRPAQEVPP